MRSGSTSRILPSATFLSMPIASRMAVGAVAGGVVGNSARATTSRMRSADAFGSVPRRAARLAASTIPIATASPCSRVP